MTTFKKWLEDGDSKKALLSILGKKDESTLVKKLDFLMSVLDLHKKGGIDEESKQILMNLLPYVKGDKEPPSVLQESQDIENTTLVLSQRFRSTRSLYVLAALCVLSIAASLPQEQRKNLISQARKLGTIPNQKVGK